MKKPKMNIWLVAVIWVALSVQAFCFSKINDGATHNINYTINDNVRVDWDMPGMKTTLNLIDSGLIVGQLVGMSDSRINILGGSVGSYLEAVGNSQVTMSSGLVYDSLFADNSSQVKLLGGSVFRDLNVRGDSQMTILGGTIGSTLYVNGNGKLVIYGSEFALNGNPFGFGEITGSSGGYLCGQLTGRLSNGDLLNNPFQMGNYGNCSIILIPEPFTLLLLGVGGVLIRK